MNLCDNNHDQVCFDERRCPMCKLLDDIKGLEEDLENARDNITELQDELTEAQQTIKDIESQ